MSGLTVNDAIVLGRKVRDSGVGNLSDVDLTDPVLDPRVRYQCASHHAYYAANGTIQFAQSDTWPLEYQNGLAIGRHKPEQQATNTYLWSDDLRRWGKNYTADISLSGIKSPANGDAWRVTTGSDRYSGLYARGGALIKGRTYCQSLFVHADSLTGPLLIGSTALGGQAQTVDFSARTSTIPSMYKYGFDESPNGWVRYWFSGPASADGTSAFVIYTAQAMTFTAWGVQLEGGPLPTSPVITAGAAATRAAAFLLVENPGGIATSIRISYSDSTTADINFPADGSSIQLPHATAEWGISYITRIQYARVL